MSATIALQRASRARWLGRWNRLTAPERFALSYDINPASGCWEWWRALDRDGYGSLRVERWPMRAHRYSWSLRHGPIPEGLHVLHECDNRRCVNPDHLRLGSNRDNMADRDKKGRSARGARHGWAKLNADQVRSIRADSRGPTEVAKDYGVSKHAIRHIRLGHTWRWLT